MNRNWVQTRISGALLALGLYLLSAGAGTAAPSELSFDVLQIGNQSYTNVTVTTRTSQYVLIVHSAGMKSFKLEELTVDEREKLGYLRPKPAKSPTQTAQAWAKQTFEAPQVKAVEQQFQQRFQSRVPANFDFKKFLTPQVIAAAGAGLLVLHLFFSWCCALICTKAGSPGGFLVWLPILQLIPLLRAAGMSAFWFLAFFIPLLNLVAQVVWSFKIAQARGKNVLLGIMLLLPLLNVFAFLFLAFSDGSKREDQKPRKVQLMTLETA